MSETNLFMLPAPGLSNLLFLLVRKTSTQMPYTPELFQGCRTKLLGVVGGVGGGVFMTNGEYLKVHAVISRVVSQNNPNTTTMKP